MNFTVGNFFFRVAYEIYRAMNKKGLTISKPVQSDFIKAPDPNFSFDCFLDEVEVFLDGQKLILLLDEFEMLEEQVNQNNLDPGIFPYLRSLMQKRQYMHFLLSGTHRIEQLTSDYWSVFFNIALHYRLPGRITADGAKALITEPMLGSLEYDVLAVAKIRQLTADQPYLIHLICGSLVAYCNEQRKNYATLNDVNLVLDEVIRTGAIHFDWLWKQLEPSKRLLLQIIAEGTKEGKRKISSKEISVIYREYGYPYHHEEVDASLKTLRNEDVIDINEDEQRKTPSDNSLYYVPIGLLRHWLRHEKPLRTKAEEEADQHAEEQSNEAPRQTPVDAL